MAQDKVFDGTMVKYLLEITASGFDMDRDDFQVTLKRGSKSLTISKAGMVVESYTEVQDNISVEKHHYYVCFDTSYFGKGTISVVVTAWAPDDDFEGGFRRIVHKFDLTDVMPV